MTSGTIRAKSCLMDVKCAEAVKSSINASAQRAEHRQLRIGAAPSAPAARKAAHDTSSTTSTVTGTA